MSFPTGLGTFECATVCEVASYPALLLTTNITNIIITESALLFITARQYLLLQSRAGQECYSTSHFTLRVVVFTFTIDRRTESTIAFVPRNFRCINFSSFFLVPFFFVLASAVMRNKQHRTPTSVKKRGRGETQILYIPVGVWSSPTVYGQNNDPSTSHAVIRHHHGTIRIRRALILLLREICSFRCLILFVHLLFVAPWMHD